MLKSNLFSLIFWLALLQTNTCSSQKTDKKQQENKQKVNSQKAMSYNISGIANGFIKSGTYGGSLPTEAFPTEYNYTFYDTKSEKNKQKIKEFESLIDKYLQQSVVNNTVTLKEYLDFLYSQNSEALNKIHSNFDSQVGKGNSHQPLPILFFVDDPKNTVLRVSLYEVNLNYPQAATELKAFLDKNARQFRSSIPDDFYNTYYKIR